MREYTSKRGHTIYYATREELERLTGYKAAHHRTRARACCPIHRGDNPTALDIDYGKGWATCHVCGPEAFSIRIEDHPDTYRERKPTGSGGLYAGGKQLGGSQRPVQQPRRPQRQPEASVQDTGVLEALSDRVEAYNAAYAGSPAAEYVRARGIPDAIAERLGWGYASDGFEGGYLTRHRLFIPLSDPAGVVTGGTGRALDSTTTPKYKTLRNADGYRKTLVHGRAIAEARTNRAPLVICEGPFDAAACLAGGLRYVVALNGVTVAPEWLMGIPRVFMATDDDAAGRAAVERLRRSVPVHVETWEEGDLSGCKDVAEHWHAVQRLPSTLRVVAADQAHPQLTTEQRTEGLELAFSMICDSWGRWERDARAALEAPDTSEADRAMIRYALMVYQR